MSSVNACKQCGSTQFANLPETGEIICENCGSVAEESRIVSEVSFSETSGGKAVVTGQYISHDQTGVLGNSLYGIQSGESRHQTIEKARRRLEQIGHGLKIPDHVVEASLRHFRTALTNNFVKGRKSQHVLCACLYLACRQNKTDHMLMDFAEAINVNVFYIGATYLQLIRNQKIRELPIVDPTVYIQRFAAKLQFGNEMGRRVVNDARLLVQRMSKDWLQQGRRPAGIAAACILLAARMNNFRRSKSEIVQVAKIAEETLQRRLDEFGRSSAGTLTIRDFRVTDIETADDPPSFRKHREKERLRLAQEQQQDSRLSEQDRQQIATQLNDRMTAIQAQNEQAYKDETGTVAFPEDPFLSKDMYDMAKQIDESSNAEITFQNDVDDILADDELETEARKMALESPEQRQQHKPPKFASKIKRNSQSERSPSPEEDESEDSQDEADDVEIDNFVNSVGQYIPDKDRLTQDSTTSQEVKPASDARPEDLGPAQKLLFQFRQRREERQSAEQARANYEKRRRADLEALEAQDLSEVDDEEIESVLLSEDEIEIKSKVWMSINKDYLLEQERKRLRKEADAANGIVKPQRKKRKQRVKTESGAATTAGANTANMLKEKVQSKKINYAAVKELFSE